MSEDMLSYAEAARVALQDAMEANPRVVALGEDLGRGGVFGQYRGLANRFGHDRVIDTPISEATIVGAAVGLALTGLRPVVEMRVVDFALCAIDEIVNQAAKNRYMFGGQGRVPAVIRMPIGLWTGAAAQHSQSLESWFAHIPGLVVLTPANPADNHALLRAAIDCGDPVAYLEHKELWGMTGPVDTATPVDPASTIGRARLLANGDALTIVSWSRSVQDALAAATLLRADGIGADVIDLRSLWPWDRHTVCESAARTGRLLVVHEAIQVAGFGAEIAAEVAEATGARVARLGAPRVPVGYAISLEDVARVTAPAIVARARALVGA